MSTSSSTFVLLYASLAQAPQCAMSIASRMAATAFEARDLDGVQRWTDRYAELRPIFGDIEDHLPLAQAG
jgi:hypothetical protein